MWVRLAGEGEIVVDHAINDFQRPTAVVDAGPCGAAPAAGDGIAVDMAIEDFDQSAPVTDATAADSKSAAESTIADDKGVEDG